MANKTQITQIFSQTVQTIHAKFKATGIGLRAKAKVPELRVKDSTMAQPDVYPLLGDRYILGRSGKSCDIVVRNPLISHVHASIERDSKNLDSFKIKDENSTNGVYMGKRRLNSLLLRHGDLLTLGPPELDATVTLEYIYPYSIWAKLIRYFLYGVSGILAVVCLWIGIQWATIPVYPLPAGIIAPVAVYGGDGQTPLNPLRKETHRELERMEDFSPYLPKAVIASEDTRYYWHLGVDPAGIARAVLTNFQSRELREGASTLTQQLARSLFPEVGRQNTLWRKLREMAVALKLEARYSKDFLLQVYLNRVYLGVSNYGFEDAAQFYFDKNAKDLTLSEAATLVGILPAPNTFNPVESYDKAVFYRNRVIARMAEAGMVTQEQADKARRSRIEVSPKAKNILSNTIGPYYYSYVFQELNDLLGEDLAKEGNFIVETTLDVRLQKLADQTLRNQIKNIAGVSQGAIVSLNTSNGEIMALTGGLDYAKSQFNRALAQRQPGSTFKVFAYTTALEQGISPYKQYPCNSLSWQGQRFRPCERSTGNIDMYTALALSENSVSLRIAQDVGLDKVVETAHNFGIKSKLDAVPGMILGQNEVNLLELTGAYASFANKGVWNRPHSIRRILDGSDCTDYNDRNTCREIYAFKDEKDRSKRVISEGIAQTMTEMMQSVITKGTGTSASLGLGEAGKTGTTNRAVDLWFVGYVPSYKIAAGVWLGNDDNKPTNSGSYQAAMLWGKYMKQATAKTPPKS